MEEKTFPDLVFGIHIRAFTYHGPPNAIRYWWLYVNGLSSNKLDTSDYDEITQRHVTRYGPTPTADVYVDYFRAAAIQCRHDYERGLL